MTDADVKAGNKTAVVKRMEEKRGTPGLKGVFVFEILGVDSRLFH